MLPLLASLITPDLLKALFKHFGPIVLAVIKKRIESGGTLPTEAELEREFNAHVDEYVAEGEEWIRTHPRR